MSLGRPDKPSGDVRDINAAYIEAYLAEYESFIAAGQQERANEVAVELRRLGHEIDKVPAGAKERAVEPPLETAVEADAPPKRRPGRPRKAATTEEWGSGDFGHKA